MLPYTPPGWTTGSAAQRGSADSLFNAPDDAEIGPGGIRSAGEWRRMAWNRN